jgi:hypothetical protein
MMPAQTEHLFMDLIKGSVLAPHLLLLARKKLD